MKTNSSTIKSVDKTNSLDDILTNNSKIISSITSNSDNYSWIELNCFFRPWAILFESFFPGYFDLFLFHISYHNSFVPNGQLEKYRFFDEFYKNVLEEKFGLFMKSIEYYSAKEMHQKIRAEIDNNSRILIPIDLFGLSYNPMYKKLSHPHFMIIKGYDVQRKIYFTLDNMHIDRGASTIYKDFVIKFSELNYMNMLYFRNYFADQQGKRFFWILNKTKNTKKPKLDMLDVLFEHREHFKNVNKQKETIKYIEQDLLNNEVDIESNEMEAIIRRKNLKSVYYSILFKFLSETCVVNEQFDLLKQQKIKLDEGWQLFVTKAVYKLAKKDNDFGDLQSILVHNIQNEKAFREMFVDITSELEIESSVDKQSSQLISGNAFVEINNNKANIIKEDGKYKIIHSSKNRYDTWITEDNAPQLLIYPNGNENFSLETKVSVTNKIGYPFFSGIIVKFASGVKLMFGNHENREVVVFCPESQNYLLYQRTCTANDLYLKVDKQGEQYTFLCKTNTTGEWKAYFRAEFTDQVECFGLISRTWEFIEHQVEFSEINHSLYP